MAIVGRRSEFSAPPSPFERQLVPLATVILGSLVVLAPVIATAPLLPPFGLIVLLAWRLPRNLLWPAWVALPLGLFDDLFSGQPLGSGMALWTIALLVIEYCDVRLLWRSYWEDWAIASLLIAGVLFGQWALVQFSGGATPVVLLLPQIVFAAMLYPLVARMCATLDRWRLAR